METKLHHSKNGLSEKVRIESVALLNNSLANLSDLYSQIKNAHWNVKGMEFYSLHTMFDLIAQDIEKQIDIVAERVTALGGTALGTVQDVVKNTNLNPYPNNIINAKEHLEKLSHNFAIVSEHARQKIKQTESLGDYATSDIYINLVKLIDLRLWFIEAHLQGK